MKKKEKKINSKHLLIFFIEIEFVCMERVEKERRSEQSLFIYLHVTKEFDVLNVKLLLCFLFWFISIHFFTLYK